MNVVQHFFEAAKYFPDNKAIIDDKDEILYSELKEKVQKQSAYFVKKGIMKGDRVLVLIPMSIDLYVNVLALFQIGAVAVFIDEWVDKKRLKQSIEIADCKAVIGSFKVRLYCKFIKVLRNISLRLNSKSIFKEHFTDVVPVHENDSALITFTTGSTGTPKASDRSHSSLNAQFKALKKEVKPKPEDIDLVSLPIVLFLNLGIGATSVIAKFNSKKLDAFSAEQEVVKILRNNINKITASPYYVLLLAKYLSQHHNVQLNKVKQIFTGGGPVFSEDASLIQNRFSAAKVNIVYGSTEAEPISSVEARELIRSSSDKGLLVGNIHEGTHLKIVDLNNDVVVLEEGQIGEIIVSGDHVLKRYFRNEQAFKENKIVEEDGIIWHKTGDSGFLQKGDLYLTGRCKELTWKNNQLIAPFVIEMEFNKKSFIHRSAVLEFNGRIILVIEYIDEQIPIEVDKNIIDEVRILTSIPMDPRHHTKVDYATLRLLLLSQGN